MITTDKTSLLANNTSADGIYDGGTTIKALFGVVAGLSMVSNALLCIVMLRRRGMLKKTYNILIFNLGITDFLTGLFLFVTPRYVIATDDFPLLYGKGGEAFCRIMSTYLLFCFGKASNGTIMCLSIDRWYSVVKPIKYRIAFGKRRLLGYIALIWLTSAVTESFGLFITKLENGRCQWDVPPYGETGDRIFLLFHISLTFYIPSLVTWLAFGHIWCHLSHSAKVEAHNSDIKRKKRLVRMCAVAAFFLTLCWFPTETFWILKKFNALELPEVWYWLFNLFAMFNSCVNPWVYCLSNKQYRKELTKVLLCWKNRDIRPADIPNPDGGAKSTLREVNSNKNGPELACSKATTLVTII